MLRIELCVELCREPLAELYIELCRKPLVELYAELLVESL